MRNRLVRLASVLIVACLPNAAPAQEGAGWPQWGGPTRNFRLESPSVSIGWPAAGPRTLWSRPLGEGYSAVLESDGVLYTLYREGEQEVVVALDAETGETRWQHAYAAPLPKNPVFDFWNTSAGPGPYASPLLVDGRLFALGVGGLLHVLDAGTGEVVWRKDLVAEFRPPDFRASAASPIAHGDHVILPVGGPGQGLVALDRATGNVAWKAQDFQDAPASPILIEVDGQEQLVVFGRETVAGVSPADGELYWTHPHATEYGLNISTPVWGDDGILLLSSAYNGGSRALRLTREGGKTRVEELWFDNRMRVHFGNMIRSGDLVIGTSGDFGPAFFTALDVRTGEEAWRERSLARSHMVFAGGKLVIVDEDGEIAVATPTASGLEIHGRAQVLKENAWTPPTLVGNRLYVRDRSSVMALDLGGD